MEIIEVLGVLAIIILIGTVVSWREMRFAFLSNFAMSNKTLVLLPVEVFKEVWYPFLNMYFPYFQHLNETGKEKFRKRLIQNLRDLEIFGKEGLEVNDEMRILLCSTLTQLTYGLKRQGLRGYKQIHVYPTTFYTKHYNDFTEAVTFSNNLIALSWIDYEKGILNPEDGQNLGLTELAYALHQTVKNGERFELGFASYIDRWLEIVNESPRKDAFYAFLGLNVEETDINMIFPEATAVFFEKPYEFKQQFATIYAHLCVLLNQNPLNVTENYVYRSETFQNLKLSEELPKQITPKYAYHTWHWSYNLCIITPFVFPFLAIYFICTNHIINVGELLMYLLGMGISLTVLTFKWNNKHALFGSTFKLGLYQLFAVGPLAFTLLLTFNDSIPLTTTIEEHRIANALPVFENGRNQHATGYITDYEFTFSDNYLAKYPFSRRIDAVEVGPKGFDQATVLFEIHRGLLGLTYISSKRVNYHQATPEHY